MAVSVIIVTFGVKDYLSACLGSLFIQSYPASEIIVIDNSPAPGLNFRAGYSGFPVKLLRSPENLFYAGGMNKGIILSKGELILCLNDDIVLDKNFIREAVRGFGIGQNIGMVSGKILRENKKTLDSTGLFLSPWWTAKERGYGRQDCGQFKKAGFIFGASGAAAFYRRKMLDDLSSRGDYFDSSFKMFYEDLDLAWRANNRGWQGYYLPQAVAYHVRGGSFRPDSGIGRPFARRYLSDGLLCRLIKNRYRAIAKNQKLPGLILHLIPILFYEAASWAYVLLRRPRMLKMFFKKWD